MKRAAILLLAALALAGCSHQLAAPTGQSNAQLSDEVAVLQTQVKALQYKVQCLSSLSQPYGYKPSQGC